MDRYQYSVAATKTMHGVQDIKRCCTRVYVKLLWEGEEPSQS